MDSTLLPKKTKKNLLQHTTKYHPKRGGSKASDNHNTELSKYSQIGFYEMISKRYQKG